MKRLLKWFSYLILLALLGASLAPTLLSTSFGTRWLSQQVAKSLDADVSIEKLELSWLRNHQRLQGIKIEKKENYNFKLENVLAPFALWKLLFPSQELGTCEITSPHLFYHIDQQQLDVVAKEEKINSSRSIDPSLFLSRHIALVVSDASITCQNSQAISEMNNIELQALTQGMRAPAALKISGQTLSRKGEGQIQVNLHIEHPKQLLSTLEARFELKSFPLEVVSPFAPSSITSLLSEWAQKPINLVFDLHREEGIGQANFHFDSKPLQVSLALHENEGSLALVEPASASFTLSPKELNFILKELKTPETLESTSDLKLKLLLTKANFDLREVDAFALEGELNLDGINLSRTKGDNRVKSHINALQGRFSRGNDLKLSLKSQKSKSSQGLSNLDLLLLAGPSLHELEFESLALNFEGLKLQDVDLWCDLPQESLKGLAWAFPISAKLHLEQKEALNNLRLSALLGQAKLLVEASSQANQQQIEHLSLDIPELVQGPLKISKLQASCKKSSIDLSDLLASNSVTLYTTAEKVAYKHDEQEVCLDQLELILDKQQDSLKHTLKTSGQASSNITSQGSWKLRKNKLKALDTIVATLSLTSQDLKKIVPSSPLAGRLDIDLFIEPSEWDLNANMAEQKVKAKAKIHPTEFEQNQVKWQVAEVKGHCQMEIGLSSLDFDVAATPLLTQTPSSSLRAQVKVLPDQLKGSFNLNGLPLALVDAISEYPIPFQPFIGSELNMDSNIFINEKQKQIAFHGSTPNSKITLKAATDAKGEWQLLEPMVVDTTFDQKAFLALLETMGKDSTLSKYTLEKPIHFYSKLKNLTWNPSSSLPQFEASLSLDNLVLEGKQQSCSANNVKLDLKSSEGNIDIKGTSLFTSTRAQAPSLSEGKLAFGAKLTGPFSSLSKPKAIDLELKALKIPTSILDLALASSQVKIPSAQALFGESVTINLQSHLVDELSSKEAEINILSPTGPCLADLSSELFQLHIDGRFDKGVLSLLKPLDFSLKVSPSLSKYLLETTGSIFISEENPPLTLKLSEKETTLPLLPYKPQALAFGPCHIEVGALECQNKGTLKAILQLLQAKQEKEEQEKDIQSINIAFTPIDLTAQEGVIHLLRTDLFAAESFAMAFWGNIDLCKENVDITLGLGSGTFETAFGIKDLPAEYMMLFHIEGPFATAGVDKTAAATKMATLLALKKGSSLTTILSLNPATMLIAKAAQSKVPVPDQNAKIPPPRYPLPWKVVKKAKDSEPKEDIKDLFESIL